MWDHLEIKVAFKYISVGIYHYPTLILQFNTAFLSHIFLVSTLFSTNNAHYQLFVCEQNECLFFFLIVAMYNINRIFGSIYFRQ